MDGLLKMPGLAADMMLGVACHGHGHGLALAMHHACCGALVVTRCTAGSGAAGMVTGWRSGAEKVWKGRMSPGEHRSWTSEGILNRDLGLGLGLGLPDLHDGAAE